MEGYMDNENDISALLKLLSDNLSLSNSPRANTSAIGPRYCTSPDNSPLMRYLLSQKLSSGCSTPMGHQFYNSNASSCGSNGGNGGGIKSRRLLPLSAIENKERMSLAAHLSPQLKMEEDVLVMDGIMVEPVLHGGPRSRSSATSSDIGGLFSPAYSSSGSGYKTEICRSWEALGTCQFGHKCQFAHGKEERCPTRLSNKIKLELTSGKSYSSGENSTHGPRHRHSHKVWTTGPPKEATGAPTAKTAPRVEAKAHTPVGLKSTPSSSTVTPATSSREWSPLDDGIEVKNSAGKPATREEVDKHINSVLYAPTKKKRLPAFVDIVDICLL